MIKTESKYESCVKANAAKLRTVQPQIQCNSHSPKCWSQQEVWETCSKKGRKTIYPDWKMFWVLWERFKMQESCSGSACLGLLYWKQIFHREVPERYWGWHKGSWSIINRVSRGNHNAEVRSALKKFLQKGSVVNRDRQDTDCWDQEKIQESQGALPQTSTRAFTSKLKAWTLPLQAFFTADCEDEYVEQPILKNTLLI